MAYTITKIVDRTNYLEVYTSATKYVEIPKGSVKLKLDGPIVWLYDNSQSAITVEGGEAQEYRLLFGSITAPVTANANALLIAILGMLNTGAVAGDASAANQLVQIRELQNSTGVASIFKNSNDLSVFTNPAGTDDVYKRLLALTGLNSDGGLSTAQWLSSIYASNYFSGQTSAFYTGQLYNRPSLAFTNNDIQTGATMALLKTAIDAYEVAHNNLYLVSRNIVSTGLTFESFSTYSTH